LRGDRIEIRIDLAERHPSGIAFRAISGIYPGTAGGCCRSVANDRRLSERRSPMQSDPDQKHRDERFENRFHECPGQKESHANSRKNRHLKAT
jgi:hypothetical protein